MQIHLSDSYLDKAELRQLKAELEARAQRELDSKLDEVNAYLMEQARARERLDKIRDANEMELRKEFESMRKELLVSRRLCCRVRCSGTTVQHSFFRTSGVSRYQNASIPNFLAARMMEVVLTTGAVRRAKLQSNRHHRQTNAQHFTGQMFFLSPNQQCQSTEDRSDVMVDDDNEILGTSNQSRLELKVDGFRLNSMLILNGNFGRLAA